jgi:hypothetical protein
MDAANRAQFLAGIVESEVANNDGEAVARTVPMAIAASQVLPSADARRQQLLTRMTLALVAGSHNDEARLTFGELVRIRPDPSAVDPRTFAGVQAVMGDLPAALAAADRAGQLVMKPDEGQEAMKRLTANVLAWGMGPRKIVGPQPLPNWKISYIKYSGRCGEPFHLWYRVQKPISS